MPGRKCVMALITATALALALPCRGGEPTREARVEAAFIYNFTQFVEWPTDALGEKGAPFIIAVLGDDPLAGALEEAMAGKTVQGRPIAIGHFASPDQIRHCHVLFVPAAQDGASAPILAKLGRMPLLTIGEGSTFMAAGGAMRLFLEDGRMKFELAPNVLDASRLKASAKLMKLARIYKR